LTHRRFRVFILREARMPYASRFPGPRDGPDDRLDTNIHQGTTMRDIAFVFLLAAVLCVTGGMFWGLQMGASGDHTMVGAHAHLNLVGWVTMALFGIYYRLTPQAARGWLPRIHAALAIGGVAVMVPGIAIASKGGTPGIAIAGSLLAFASMLVFLFTVIRHGFGAAPADARRATGTAALNPAE
jgi:hypothetical protein